MFKTIVIIVSICLTACSAPRPHAGSPPHALPEFSTAETSLTQWRLPAGSYRIDTQRSELRILVYKAGPLAHLGHNHVMVNRALSGSIVVIDGSLAVSLDMHIPVDQFIVDDAQSRREEGADFPAEISDDAKEGTLHNMLSAAVLNVAEYPEITLKILPMTRPCESCTATLRIGVAGHDATVAVPFKLETADRQLTASGSFELRQTSLGLTPYSLMLGALQVQDAMILKFSIVVPLG